jgi:ABC-type uncharacterized transport system substrate-binding protein
MDRRTQFADRCALEHWRSHAFVQYAAELIALGPDVVLAGVGATTPTLQQASRTVPIVFVQGIDPVGAGLVESLARPRQQCWLRSTRL